MKNGSWVTAEIKDKEIVYSFESHSPVALKGTPWLYCKYCGLVYLRNKLTRWCIKSGCNNAYHKDYERMLKLLPK